MFSTKQVTALAKLYAEAAEDDCERPQVIAFAPDTAAIMTDNGCIVTVNGNIFPTEESIPY